MKVSVLGLGWFGAPLARELASHFEVSGTTTTPDKIPLLEMAGIHTTLLMPPGPPSKTVLDADIVVLNIPPFEGQLEWFRSFSWGPDTWMIFISSTSGRGELPLQEEWVKKDFRQWTILRFGGLIGPDRHPGNSLCGKQKLPGKLWPVNLIHLDDCIGVVKTVIRKQIKSQTLNVVSSEHPTRESYYSSYCQKEGLPLPCFDQTDKSQKNPVDNSELLKHYSVFKQLL